MIAGLVEQGHWLDPKDSLEGMEKEPGITTLGVNLKGAMYFARIAFTYLAHGQKCANRQESDAAELGRRVQGDAQGSQYTKPPSMVSSG